MILSQSLRLSDDKTIGFEPIRLLGRRPVHECPVSEPASKFLNLHDEDADLPGHTSSHLAIFAQHQPLSSALQLLETVS